MEILIIILLLLVVIRSIYNKIVNIKARAKSMLFFKNNVINKIIETESKNKKVYYKDVQSNKLAELNVGNIDSLKDYLYKIFVDFEKAYNNLDYNSMKTLSTKQLYQNYYTGITLDLNAGEKRIIDKMQKNKMYITDIYSSDLKQLITTVIDITYINYTMNKNGVVVKGDRDRKTTEKFEVIFRKDFESENAKKCPNCGATYFGNRCEYCNTAVKNSEFKISSIKKIIENN